MKETFRSSSTIVSAGLAIGLIVAILLFFALPDQRWIAGIVLLVTVVEAVVLAKVLPRMTADSKPADRPPEA